MRLWCAGESKQRPRDSIEKPSTHTQDVALVVGSMGPALLRILRLGDGSGALWKLYGISRHPLSPWSAGVPISPPSAPVPPDVFHGNFDLTDAEDVARALKSLTGITHFYVTWESHGTDAPVREANWAMLALSVFVSNCTKRLRVCLQTTGKATVGATLLDNAFPLCSRVGLTDAGDIAKPLTDIVHFYVAWESHGTDAPVREANWAMRALSVFVSNCTKRLRVCLQTTGKATVGATLLDNAFQLCSRFSLTDAADIAKPLTGTGIVHFYVAWESRGTDAPAREANWAMLALSVFVSNCSKRLHVCLQTTGKVTVGATLLDNAFLLCTRFGLTDARDIGKPLTGIVHFYVACESRGTDAPARGAKSALLRNALPVCNKRLHFCLQTTGKCTVAALRTCSHFDLIHPDNITILKPLNVFPPVLCNSISVHVCLHIGPSSQNVGSPWPSTRPAPLRLARMKRIDTRKRMKKGYSGTKRRARLPQFSSAILRMSIDHVVLLPCRHMCLYPACDAAVGTCPVCPAAKNASLLYCSLDQSLCVWGLL
ncbi:hypothetical protein ACQ4PT_052357 [Festuca glaucescens]